MHKHYILDTSTDTAAGTPSYVGMVRRVPSNNGTKLLPSIRSRHGRQPNTGGGGYRCIVLIKHSDNIVSSAGLGMKAEYR